MKVLIPIDNIYESDNPYFREIISHIKLLDSSVEFIDEINSFWNEKALEADIIHIQFPHFLLKFNSKNERHSVSELENRLDFLKAHNVKIAATCHNLVPHYKDSFHENESYKVVYSLCDAIFHLGSYSLDKCKIDYPKACHYLLEHPVYNSHYNFIPTREESLDKLGLSNKYSYILCFGAFRSDEERNLVIKASKLISNSRVRILAPSFSKIKFRRNLFIFAKNIFKYISYKLMNPKIIIFGKSVSDELVPYLFSCCDISLIQRVKILNSGNLPLSYYFSNVVVGPDIGNVGEILKQTGNPVFDVNNLDSLKMSFEKAFDLINQGKGEKNKSFAMKNWTIEKISEKQFEYYTEILSRGGVQPYSIIILQATFAMEVAA